MVMTVWRSPKSGILTAWKTLKVGSSLSCLEKLFLAAGLMERQQCGLAR